MSRFLRRARCALPLFRFKASLALLVLFYGLEAIAAQAPPYYWAKGVVGAADDSGNGISADGGGNSFVTGYFQSTNAAFGTIVLTNRGGADIFLAKYGPYGDLLWARTAGGSDDDSGNAIATDGSGNSYVTGYFISSNFNIGGLAVSNRGSADAFVAKYSSGGSLLWAKAAGGTGYDAANGIAVDSAGSCYVTGFFYSSNAVFGAVTLTNSGQNNIFIAKYDSTGNLLWAKQAGGSSFEVGVAVAVDSVGNCYITGNFFSTTADFGGGIALTNSGENDAFVAKYNPSGNALWARQVQGPSDEFVYGIAVDSADSSLVTGTFFSDVVTLGPGVTLTNSGYNDIFVVKYDTAGNVIWARAAGGSSDDYSYAITTDASNNVYLAGDFYSPNASFGGILLTNAGAHDVFVAKYDASGNAVWAKRAGGVGSESASGLVADADGNLHLTGSFASPAVSFDAAVVTNTGGADIFVAEINGDRPRLGIARAGGSLLLSWPTNYTGYNLESTITLSNSNNWSPVSATPVAVGNQNVVTNSSQGRAFFRLRK